MTKKTDKSFLVEASIISVSNFVVKIIGVLFSIPLSNILGSDGMEPFNAAYSVYAMLYMVSTAGLPVATSRMVAASAKRGRGYEVARVYRVCLYIFGIIGFVFSALMLAFAGKIAKWTEHPNSVDAIRIIAPTLFFICIVSALRGYLQGLRNMVPTAVSQFIESFLKLIIGVGMAYWSNRRGDPVSLQAAYAILGITVGAFFGMIYLILYKRFSKKTVIPLTDYDSDSSRAILVKLSKIALPVTITSSALYISHFADTVIIKKALISTGFPGNTAGNMYSAYTTLATKVSDLLPSTFVFPIAISILPAISSALAVNNKDEASNYIHSSMRLSGLIALPCSALLFVLARPCIAFLFGSNWGPEDGSKIQLLDGSSISSVDLASRALSILAIGIFFISMVSTTNALLQAIGKERLPMISVCSGACALVATELLIVPNQYIHIYGAAIGTLVCYIVAYALNVAFLSRAGVIPVSPFKLFAKPFFAAVVTAAATYGAYSLSGLILHGDDRIHNLVRLAVPGVFGVIVYAIMLLLIKGISESEVRLLPFGNHIADKLISLKLLKKGEK